MECDKTLEQIQTDTNIYSYNIIYTTPPSYGLIRRTYTISVIHTKAECRKIPENKRIQQRNEKEKKKNRKKRLGNQGNNKTKTIHKKKHVKLHKSEIRI